MKDTRSPSQILFSYLPAQTSDIKGRIWKVDKWTNPLPIQVDTDGIRQRLIAAIEPWRANGTDNGLSSALRQGRNIEVVGVNPQQGVKVDSWPNIWLCQACRRVGYQKGRCECGSRTWAQLHFVAFHECGYLGEPLIPRCQQHGESMVQHSKSSSVRDLEFSCPTCKRALSSGLGAGRPCPGCGKPGVAVNVHRAASVYTPYTFTMVNPARPDQLRALLADGDKEKSLRWLLEDMRTERPEAKAPSRQSIIDGFVSQGFALGAAEAAVDAMVQSGAVLAADDGGLELPQASLEAATTGALDVALAMYEGHRSARSMGALEVDAELLEIYSKQYPRAIRNAGLLDVDYVDRFPILRGVFGYTRGGKPAGESRLVPFVGNQQSMRVHADANETEAFYLRLDPVRVSAWLKARGLIAHAPSDAVEARMAVLKAVEIPSRGEEVTAETAGSAVLTLLHSYAHRFTRQLAVLAGVDRESLAEYLVPQHLGVFVYAAPRGNFVLGGLQAVFETSLDRVLDLQLNAETRCPLDPGCDRASGACLACLHIGEPSCSHYNRFLDRKTLFGDRGYLRQDLA